MEGKDWEKLQVDIKRGRRERHKSMGKGGRRSSTFIHPENMLSLSSAWVQESGTVVEVYIGQFLEELNGTWHLW